MRNLGRGATALGAIAVLLALLLGAMLPSAAAQPPDACGANPSPPDAADPSVRVTAPSPDAIAVSPLHVSGLARVFEAAVSLELRDAAGRLIAEGHTMSAEGAPTLAPYQTDLAFTVAAATPACLRVFERSARDGSPRNVVQVPLTLLPAASPRFVEAALFLGDPRPCVPDAGQRVCDATRTALWNGEARAWAARGVTDSDRRFVETVILRVRAGDPGAIANIARALGQPYLKITRVRFGGGDLAEVTNLGGGAQQMTGWTLRSPARNLVFRFPDGFALGAGESRVVCGSCIPSCPINPQNPTATQCPGPDPFQSGLRAPDAFPDDVGRAVLFYDALNLPGDDVAYSADPNNQPPPPNLQGVRIAGDPNQRGPLSFILTTSKQVWASGEPVQFQMLLQNLGDQPQQVEMPSGQDFDITVSNEAGEVVWQWSRGIFFTQVVRTLTFTPHEQRTFTATWDSRANGGNGAPPGRYEASAVYTATERIPSNVLSFTIAAGSAGPRVQDYGDLIDALRAAGVAVEDAGPVSSPILGGEVRSLRVDGETLQAFEYASADEAAADAARLSSDGSTYRRGPNGPVINVDWIAPPHVYLAGRVIVIYVGRDAGLLALLESLLGRQVAGG